MSVDSDTSMMLLALGPAGAAGLYWMLYRYYRNTEKSHRFEQETKVEAQAITGEDADVKVDEIQGTQEASIRGNNVGAYRQRVRRV